MKPQIGTTPPLSARIIPVSLASDDTMGLLEALLQGDALFRGNGIAVCVHPILSEYKVTVLSDDKVYEGVARISRVHSFLYELGVPFSNGWEVINAD
jgi:hypothetical protein